MSKTIFLMDGPATLPISYKIYLYNRAIPAGLSYDEAAVYNGAFETSYHGLIHCGNLKKGIWIFFVKMYTNIHLKCMR